MFRYGKMYDKKGEMAAKPWVGKMEPFKIAGNVYYIGTYQASCHLIDTGDGLILVDPGYSATAYLVIDSIYRLGFDPRDIKYIINTHWHGDHVEATEAFADLTGAKTLLGRDDEEKAKKHFVPDILIDDGDTLTLGNTTLTFMHTPGHTKGTVSFFFDVEVDGTVYRAGSFGGTGTNTLVPEKYDFEGCREAFYNTLERLKKEKVDIFLGNHTWNNGTYEKYEEMTEKGNNPFIDSEIWGKFLDSRKETLDNLIAKEKSNENN